MIADPIPAIRALPVQALAQVSGVLQAGRLTGGVLPFGIRHVAPAISEAAAIELAGLLASGLGAPHAAVLLDAVAAERKDGAARLELVTSGPDTMGSRRDTGVVLRQLFAGAQHRVLVVGFAVHQGREVFAALATRMHQVPDLAVRLCLDVRRAAGDTTRSDGVLCRFSDRFVRQEWPGPRLPDVFYDPRSLAETDTRRASLHAKCVVIDGVRAFIGSANFTEAAQLRNIEVGVVVDGAEIAEAVERHFETLIAHDQLRSLDLVR